MDIQHFLTGKLAMKLESLKDLYVEQLQDLYSAETQITEALPQMAEAATSPKLKKAFTVHLEETKGQVERLQKIFDALGSTSKGKKCKGMEGLLKEGIEMIKEDAEPAVKDAGLIAAAQRVEHYEMAGYGTVRAYAELLKYTDAVKLLEQTLKQEEATDEKLTTIAENEIYIDAE